MTTQGMTIGTLARRAGVNIETIRYYHRRRLLPAPARAYGTVRRYGEDSLQRLAFIKRAQRLGFSLDEIEALLALNDGTRCSEARRLAEQKLQEIVARLHDLQAMHVALEDLVGRCATARGKVACPLIATLGNPESGVP
jgi:MerR family mercuric resistance operon transcriptional regulator